MILANGIIWKSLVATDFIFVGTVISVCVHHSGFTFVSSHFELKQRCLLLTRIGLNDYTGLGLYDE